MRMPFGKHFGKELHEVPQDYLMWVLDKAQACTPTLRRAIEQVLGLGEPPAYPGLELEGPVARWYRKLALKYHPDRGGTNDQMRVVNDALELLKSELGMEP